MFKQSISPLFLLGIEDILRGAQELDSVIKQGYLEKKSNGINQTHDGLSISGDVVGGRKERGREREREERRRCC